MAPNLALHDHLQLVQLNQFKLTRKQIAAQVKCSKQTVTNTRSNLRKYASARAPRNKPGRPRCITPEVGEAILERLREKPDQYQDEIAAYIEEVFEVPFSVYQISRFLKEVRWNKKVVCSSTLVAHLLLIVGVIGA